jgi:dipeptidyl aminopeptidase/acylaminoacyl peptidase
LWLVDPLGKENPVCLSGNLGRRDSLSFRLALKENLDTLPADVGAPIYLTAFNLISKQNGFFQVTRNAKGIPKKLFLEDRIYYHPMINSDITSFPPLKSLNGSTYLIQTMSEKEFPNLLCTHDFKSFQSLSALQPQNKYNWITAELVHWRAANGKPAEGVLYKPENFDSKKEYPVIFALYETFSDYIHSFIKPAPTRGSLNIPYFVSNGYIVVEPDIRYTMGKPIQSVVDYVIPLAEELARHTWVNRDRFGVYGMSFGGFEVYSLIGKTKIFKAAVVASGISDLISMYGGMSKRYGISNQYSTEIGQLRIGAPLWERPNLYFANSSIFYANKIVTPLLIMSNNDDDVVPSSQGVEMFTALRRLRKKCWMLQYENEGHSLEMKENQLDYTMRIYQFYDFYLRGAAIPEWMKR